MNFENWQRYVAETIQRLKEDKDANAKTGGKTAGKTGGRKHDGKSTGTAQGV